MNVSPNGRPRRLRFSLGTFALAFTLVALGLGLWSAWRTYDRLAARFARIKEENAKLRDELGVFDVGDPAKIHAIRVEAKSLEQAGQQTHRFRVYLPPGRKHELFYQTNEIPAQGLPRRGNPTELASGMNLITITYEAMRDRRTGENIPFAVLDIEIEGDGQSVGATVSMGERHNDWILNKLTKSSAFGTKGLQRSLEMFAVGDPVTLLRARAVTIIPRSQDAAGRVTTWSTAEIATPCDGFMVWIESSPLDAAGAQAADTPEGD